MTVNPPVVFLLDECLYKPIHTIGAITLSKTDLLTLEKEIKEERLNTGILGEVKWSKLAHSDTKHLNFYKKIVDLAMSKKSFAFHVNGYRGNQYKAGYALIRSISWKLKRIGYTGDVGIIFDNTSDGRSEAKTTLDALQIDDTFYHTISFCQPSDSKSFETLQISDLLTGAVGYKLKGGQSINQDSLVKQIESLDSGYSLTTEPTTMWGYYKKKIQYYDLGNN